MYAFQVVTTTLNLLMMGIMFLFMRGLSWKKEKESVIGFSAMQIVYLMNLFCIWR